MDHQPIIDMTSMHQPCLGLLTGTAARLLAIAGISLFAPSLIAATGIWNGSGGDGFWDITANTEWSGVTGDPWDAANGPTNIAQFNAGPNANIGTSGTPVVNGIIWNGVGGGVSSGSVKLDGVNPFISVSSGQTSQIYANILGTNGFTKMGAGQLTLIDSLKSITGGIIVSQGSLRLSLVASGNVVNSFNTLSLSGSQLEAFGNGTQTLSTFTLGNGGSRIVINPNGAANSTTLSLPNWTRASNSAVVFDYASTGTAKTLTLTGTLPTVTNSIIGGYATVRDSLSTYGFATLDGSNNVIRYTGATVVNAALGANTVSATNYRATTAGTWFNGTGTSQTLNSLEIAIAGTVSGNNAATYILNSGGLLFSDTSNTTNGGNANMTFTSATSELHIATMQYNSGFAVPSVRGVTDNGGISVNLIKDGTGGLSMATGTFSHTGDTIVNDGILYSLLNIPSGTGKGNLVVNSRGTVTIGITTTGTRTINGLSNTSLGGGTVNNQNFTSTAATSFLNLGNNNATASFSGAITGNFGIIKNGTGSQTFSGSNNYTGTTQVNAGTLQFNKSSSLYNNTVASWTAANINVKSGATLAINVGGTGEFTTGNVTTLLTNLAASSSSTNGMNAGSRLAFDTNNASGGTFTISDVIADTTGASGGTRSLTKLGTGALTLSAANTYTGTTLVSAGTLLINGSTTSTISVATGATIGGTGSTTGALTINGSISPGVTAGALSAGATTLAASSSYVWDIGDWSGSAGVGYDTLSATSLDITATNSTPITLRLRKLAGSGFTESNKSFTLVSTTGGVSGFALDKFQLDDSGFTGTVGTWSLAVVGNNLLLSYSADPVALNDAVTMHRGQKVLVAVMKNDRGVQPTSTVSIVSPPSFGTAVADSSGKVLYIHTTGTPTSDSFTYRVHSNGTQSAPATVTITFSTSLRIANDTLNVPANAPTTAVQIVPAFGSLTFTKPLSFDSPPGDTQRLFVGELGGRVKVIPNVTAPTPTSAVVLDLPLLLATRVGESIDPGFNGECGLLGLAFHPNFANNGYFYITYSVRKATDNTVWYQRLSRFTIPAAQMGQPTPVADTTSEIILIEQRDREDNHNGGDIHFGADGYLYYAVGDEGNPNDHFNNSQRIDLNFFAAMLRIDVDKKPGNLAPNPHASVPTDSGVARYSVPANNPYVGATTFNGAAVTPANVRTEFWAVGLRSPWRFSIDAPTGDIWLGETGQDTIEEIDLVTSGANYGWAFREGTLAGPKATALTGFANPIYEYTHNGTAGDANFKGNSVIGGVVYRGARFQSLAGAYIFGDFISGNIWALTRPGGVATVQRIAGSPNAANFGTDPSNGDVILSSFFSGTIMRVVTATPGETYPSTLSATGLFADLTDLSPAPGLLPYEPKLSFWSDHAVKRRWFTIPDAASKITWSRDNAWTTPSGMIWVKNFEMEMTRGNPATKKRIETRVLVRNATGSYGVSYRWNEAQTEATLAADGGEDFDLAITQNGQPYTQRWRIPSRSECITCHSPNAGHALSFNTRQLNLTNTINGSTGNQLTLLANAGYFANSVPSPNLLPRHLRPSETSFPVEARARSYFAVNCAYCHMPGGSGPAWDGRPELTLTQTGLINGPVGGALNVGDKLIVPGDTAHSVVLNRMALTNGYTRMPPLGSSELDQTNIALITNWINNSLPTRQTYTDWRFANFGSTTSPEGAPTADPDGDAATNQAEYLAGTSPGSGASFLSPQVSLANGTATLAITLPANRSAVIETSLDLTTWWTWDIPGNAGLPTNGGTVTISGPAASGSQFFRVRLGEN